MIIILQNLSFLWLELDCSKLWSQSICTGFVLWSNGCTVVKPLCALEKYCFTYSKFDENTDLLIVSNLHRMYNVIYLSCLFCCIIRQRKTVAWFRKSITLFKVKESLLRRVSLVVQVSRIIFFISTLYNLLAYKLKRYDQVFEGRHCFCTMSSISWGILAP